MVINSMWHLFFTSNKVIVPYTARKQLHPRHWRSSYEDRISLFRPAVLVSKELNTPRFLLRQKPKTKIIDTPTAVGLSIRPGFRPRNTSASLVRDK